MDINKAKDRCIYTFTENNIMHGCEKESIKNNCFCEEHQQYLSDLNAYAQKDKMYCCETVKKMLHNIELLIGKKYRADEMAKMFEFLSKHKYFVYSHARFADTMLAKLLEIEESCESELFDSKKYMKLLFPLLYDDGKINENTSEVNVKINEIEDITITI